MSNDSNASAQPAGDDLLRELATRLLAFRFGEGQDEPEPQLLVGVLPPDLPLALPVPEGARVLGSFISARPIIVLDTDLEPDAALDFYEQQLAALGWRGQEHVGPGSGGFVHSMQADRPVRTFEMTSGEDDAPTHALTIMAGPGPDERTTVQITLHPEGNGVMPRRRMLHRDVLAVLPPIRPPKHARQMPQGGGGGPDAVHSSAGLETDLNLADVAPHYRADLERAGWQRGDGGEDGPAAWSVWSFHDEEGAAWSAMLFILQRSVRPGASPGASLRYTLQLEVERVDGGAGIGQPGSGGRLIGTHIHSTVNTGWTTFGPISRRRPQPPAGSGAE